MDYKKAYEEALERAKSAIEECGNNKGRIAMIESIFPELKEPDDEKIRKQIISFLKEFEYDHYRNLDFSSWIAWLEKQGKQKLTHKVGPKFHEGEWISNGDYTWRIIEVNHLDYILQSQDGRTVDDTISFVDEYFHLWTLKDAKDGYVLVNNERPFIFKGFLDSKHPGYPVAYCGINAEDHFYCSVGDYWWTNNKNSIKPATKEERELLFQKIKESGYEWNGNTNELKKKSL